MNIVLASASPRRKEILQNLGLDFTCLSPDTDEQTDLITADRVVKELSLRKAEAAAMVLQAEGADLTDTLIIAADTAVVCDLAILGKPRSVKQATDMLQRLSGRTHFVTTGVTLLYHGQTVTENELTKLRFATLTKEQIDGYVATKEPMDKAGSYGIQGMASSFIEGIEGDYFNVVGFPVFRFCQMLLPLGLHYVAGKGILPLASQ